MKKKYKVLWTDVAEKDLVDIIEYIAEDSPETALQVMSMLRDKVSQLFFYPERGRIVPELHHQGISKYRELVIPPWRVMFRISENTVYVLSVIDSRRNVEDILLRRVLGERI